MNYLRCRCTWNIQISPLTKITKLIWCLRAICFHLSQHAENETKSRKRWVWLACEHRRILVGYLKLFRFMNVMRVQTKCKLNNTELFLKLFHIQRKDIGNNKYYEATDNRTWKMAKWDIAWILTFSRKEIEDSTLNATECLKLITFAKCRLNFSCKSTTAANVDLTESVLDNWLKNNHITVD